MHSLRFSRIARTACLLLSLPAFLVGCGGSGTQPAGTSVRTFVVVIRDNNLFVADANGQNERPLMTGQVPDSNGAASPDGKYFAIPVAGAGKVDLRIYDLSTGEFRTVVSSNGFGDLAFSPDGQRVAWASAEGGSPVIRAASVADGTIQTVTTFTGGVSGGMGLSWDPKGRYFAGTDETGHVQLVPISGGSPTKIGDGGYPSFSPDGRRLAFVTADGKLKTYDLSSRQTETSAVTDSVMRAFYDPTGLYLYVTAMKPVEDGWSSRAARVALGGNRLQYLAESGDAASGVMAVGAR